MTQMQVEVTITDRMGEAPVIATRIAVQWESEWFDVQEETITYFVETGDGGAAPLNRVLDGLQREAAESAVREIERRLHECD